MENNTKMPEKNDPSPAIDKYWENQHRIQLLMEVAKLPGLFPTQLEILHTEIFKLLNITENK
jgi:hypothetical protein